MRKQPSAVPWESPLRTRRIDENDRPISAEEWRRWEWVDVTSLYDPDDVHRYARTLRLKETGEPE